MSSYTTMELILILIIICALMLFFYNIYKWPLNNNNNNEGFTNTNTNTNTNTTLFGNLLIYKLNAEIKNNLIYYLPGRTKLTGIHLKTPANAPKYKIYIGDSETDINTADGRRQIDVGLVATPASNSNSNSNEIIGIFTDSKAEYIGNVILIESNDIENINKIDEIKVYGMSSTGLDSQFYKNMPKIVNTTITVNDSDDNKHNKNIQIKFKQNHKVAYLEIPFLTLNSLTDFTIHIRYSNSLDGNNNIYSLKGTSGLQYFSDGSPSIYLNEPIIAEYIYISMPSRIIDTIKSNYIQDNYVYVYGTISSNRDEVNFKLRSPVNVDLAAPGIIISGSKCPNIKDMMHKQLQAQQICEALEYKDKSKNKKIAYEKEKAYLRKLEQQDSEIKRLDAYIGKLIERKQARLNNQHGNNMEDINKDFKSIESIKKAAEDYIQNRKSNIENKVNLSVKLNPNL